MPDARILIADDYEDNRELLRLILETSGYQITEARNGAECVAKTRAENFDLALIDLSMPVLDGWSALKEIRNGDNTRHLPCVALTAFAAEEDRQRALDAGFDAYLAKPYRSKDLLELVESLISRGRNASGKDTSGASAS